MIKLFRRNRKDKLEEGNTSAYLKYAVGEIVLVVIGILIALGINNWNEGRKIEAKRMELLKGISKELAQDIASHNRMIGFYQDRLSFFERHLQKTDFSDTHPDTLFKIFDGSAGAHTVSDQNYQKAKNLGIGQLCSNDSLAMRIDDYYTRNGGVSKLLFDYDFDMTEKQNDFWTGQENLEFHYHTSLSIPFMQDSAEWKMEAIKLITSPLGRNNIKSECLIKEMLLNYNLSMRATAESLKNDIDTYLKVN